MIDAGETKADRIMRAMPPSTPTLTNTETITPTSTDTFVQPENPGPSDKDIPFFMTRLVTDADLAGKSPWELRIMRNEIYARHGRGFNSTDLQEYF